MRLAWRSFQAVIRAGEGEKFQGHRQSSARLRRIGDSAADGGTDITPSLLDFPTLRRTVKLPLSRHHPKGAGMTCEICVMNRHAAVLAADSASTVARWVDGKLETRYFKGANKIFQLSHHRPVGVMIFNAADLLNVPWEILLKTFRDELADKSFNNLEGYAEEFFSFLDGNARCFPEDVQKQDFVNAAERAAYQTVFTVVDALEKLNSDAAAGPKLRDAITRRKNIVATLPLPKRITDEHLQRALVAHRDAVATNLKVYLKVDDELQNSLAELAINEVFKRPGDLLGSAGLVFAGFGDHDIFPHMIEYRSNGMLEGTQVIEQVSRGAIDHSLPATLNAFAQTSMSDTFTIGFSADVYNALMALLNQKLGEFATKICDAAGVQASTIKDWDQLIGKATSDISDGWFESARREHAYPLRRVLGDLPVEEMAELAETLVNLQSLKEKVTKPSASVGGPVDVAVITKNEGLVWIKRKLYFDGALNPRYHYRQQGKYR
jgi:hypothetical protein